MPATPQLITCTGLGVYIPQFEGQVLILLSCLLIIIYLVGKNNISATFIQHFTVHIPPHQKALSVRSIPTIFPASSAEQVTVAFNKALYFSTKASPSFSKIL